MAVRTLTQVCFTSIFLFHVFSGNLAAEDVLRSILARASSVPTEGEDDWAEASESLLLLARSEVPGRHRFVLPSVRSRGTESAKRLRGVLEQRGVVDEVHVWLDGLIQEALQGMRDAAVRGDQAEAYRLRWRSEGLQSMLPTPQTQPKPWAPAETLQQVRVSRSAVNFPLVTWGPGTYAVGKSPNFSIASQAGDKPTAEMAEMCEQIFAVWKQMFFASWASEQTVAPEFLEPQRAPFRVVLFRSRDAYVKALRAIEPRIGESTGYYSPQHRMSFFYWDGSKSMATLVHELTHQFFSEAREGAPPFDADKAPGFWVIEGVALYMESFSRRNVGGAHRVDVGGWDAPRLQAGRYRRLHDEYWIPWEEFQGANGAQFRRAEELPAWYSQACGLTHRWLDGSSADRSLFTSYLNEVYAGRGQSASQALGADDETVREAYDRYLLQGWRAPPEETSGRPFFPNRNEVVLSRCEVRSQDLLEWPVRYRKMEWLDLSHTPIDDRWLIDAGENEWDVVRLNLESTAVTDRAMAAIARMSDLRELDLTRCHITDRGVATLQGHPNLRQLWLGHTQMGDESIEVLLSLPRLERLSVEGSQISDAGWKRILAKKPYLKR